MTLRVRRLVWLSWLGLSWVLQTGATVGDPVASKSAEAREHYQRGEYEEALRLYRDAQLEDPDSPLLHFNAGDALFKLGQHGEALEEFGGALRNEDPGLRAQTFYNMGNALFQQQQFQPAIESYKQALELDSADQDAKANLELALQYLQQQQEPQQGQQEQQEQQDQQDQQRQQGQQDQQQEQEQQQEDQAPPEDPQDSSPASENAADEKQDQPEQMSPGEKEDEMDPEEAERILSALEDRENQAQKRRFKAATVARGKDW